MYSVIRFTIDDKDKIPQLEQIGLSMNELEAETYDGIRKPKGDGFVCDISFSDEWYDHKIELINFLKTFPKQIKDAHELGVRITFDTAVDTEDIEPFITVVPFDLEMLDFLNKSNVKIEVSIYISRDNIKSLEGIPAKKKDNYTISPEEIGEAYRAWVNEGKPKVSERKKKNRTSD